MITYLLTYLLNIIEAITMQRYTCTIKNRQGRGLPVREILMQ